MKNYVILSNTLVLTHEKCNSLSKGKNICREGSAGSLPNLYLLVNLKKQYLIITF